MLATGFAPKRKTRQQGMQVFLKWTKKTFSNSIISDMYERERERGRNHIFQTFFVPQKRSCKLSLNKPDYKKERFFPQMERFL